MAAVSLKPDPNNNYWHNVNNLDTCTAKWKEVGEAHAWAMPLEFEDMSLSVLLFGFFEYGN